MKFSKSTTILSNLFLILLIVLLSKFLTATSRMVLSSCQSSKSDEIKSEEKIIADSPASLKEFLLKTVKKLKNHVEASPFPKKGEFETTKEYNIRFKRWNARGGIGNSILYKATGLFPVNLGKYYADWEKYEWIEINLGHYNEIEKQGVNFHLLGIRNKINSRSTFGQSYWVNPLDASVNYPREKARLLRKDNLRCDIVFSLNFQTVPGSVRYKKHTLSLSLHNIKFYSPETGDIIFQASRKK